ncbi:MAG TPA: hypothetical protein VGD87_12680 [Archangium sp.]
MHARPEPQGRLAALAHETTLVLRQRDDHQVFRGHQREPALVELGEQVHGRHLLDARLREQPEDAVHARGQVLHGAAVLDEERALVAQDLDLHVASSFFTAG